MTYHVRTISIKKPCKDMTCHVRTGFFNFLLGHDMSCLYRELLF
jgi:hypothetical protein